MTGSILGPVLGAGRFAVMVPTTGELLHLCALVPRPGLPHGAAFAIGDYRPLPLSADYRALAGPEGPIARHLGAPITPHELRLSGAPDGGRSWEAPVALAHLMLSRGWTLAKPQEPAELTIWATGAVDLDMRLLSGDYALERKVDMSMAELAAAGKSVVAILPPGAGQDAALARLDSMGIRTLCPEQLDDALALLTQVADPHLILPKKTPPRRNRLPMIAAASVVVAGLAAIVFILPADRGGPDNDRLSQLDALGALNGELAQIAAPDPALDSVIIEPPVAEVAEIPEEVAVPEADTDPPAIASPPAVTLAEVRVAEGGSCRAALFDPGRRILQPVPWGADGFAATRFDAALCGIALSLADGSLPPVVQADPPDAFVEASGAEGSRVLFLREGVRNVVYTFPDPDGGVDDAPIRHQIVVPDP